MGRAHVQPIRPAPPLLREGWSGVDVQLRRRADLIPNLVSAVQASAQHERHLLEQLTRLRARSLAASTVEERIPIERDLDRGLDAVLAFVGQRPALRSSGSFLHLQQKLAEVEEQLQYARRYYNATVREYNTLVEAFPSCLLARLFRWVSHPYFDAGPAAERTPAVAPRGASHA